MLYATFIDALLEFREAGGAMIFHGGPGLPCYEVKCADELDDDQDALKTTRHALSVGGMSKEQIDEELKDWQQ
mgnify:CR=1 FL=1